MSVSEPLSQASDSQNSLILDSLEVKNFRAFRHLTIEKLGRVNLITGKNNVGKTSLLEALWVYTTNGRPQTLRKLLDYRGQLGEPLTFSAPIGFLDSIEGSKSEVGWLPYIYNLYYGQKSILKIGPPFSIGEHSSSQKQLTVTVEWIVPSRNQTEDGDQLGDIVNEDTELDDLLYAKPYLSLKIGDRPTAKFDFTRGFAGTLYWLGLEQRAAYYVTSSKMDAEVVAELWDRAILNGMRSNVEDTLRFIDNKLEHIEFVSDATTMGRRMPFAKMSHRDNYVSVNSLGDGIGRALGFALVMANAKGGSVMLDEIENGIHYSVLPDIWRFIFQTARRLNVQVFATTHSWDCIEAFQQAASEDEADGALIRLQNKNGDVVATVFDEEDLAVVTREGIEVR